MTTLHETQRLMAEANEVLRRMVPSHVFSYAVLVTAGQGFRISVSVGPDNHTQPVLGDDVAGAVSVAMERAAEFAEHVR